MKHTSRGLTRTQQRLPSLTHTLDFTSPYSSHENVRYGTCTIVEPYRVRSLRWVKRLLRANPITPTRRIIKQPVWQKLFLTSTFQSIHFSCTSVNTLHDTDVPICFWPLSLLPYHSICDSPGLTFVAHAVHASVCMIITADPNFRCALYSRSTL